MNPPPKKRWLRFSLRTVLVITACGCVVMGLKVQEVKKQQAVVQWVVSNGGRVLYDFEYEGTASPPRWCIDLFGVDYFAKVVAVSLPSSVADVKPLAQITSIRSTFRYPVEGRLEVTTQPDGRRDFSCRWD